MQDFTNNEFLNDLRNIISDNIRNEQFGVSELAEKVGMSRSNLLRKVTRQAGISVSQFIREVRLEHAMELLRNSDSNVSEVAWQVGFNSTSYFIKCFREAYGYPPGETAKHIPVRTPEKKAEQHNKRNRYLLIALPVFLFTILLLSVFGLWNPEGSEQHSDKSIAVLPFKNDSNDSTNLYIINGLMESILNNLQKIEDLRVISRTSVEKYRNSGKTIPEIAKELNVKYFVEGSGQKIGNRILLNVQLINATHDTHLWAEQYEKNTSDIFKLQQDVSKNIAQTIKAIITPEEEERINKVPTSNLVAYDYFLKGLDYFHQGNRNGLIKAVEQFKIALQHDPEFARAYADIAISYYYMDLLQAEKQFTDSVNFYSDNALLYDPELAQSLVAKALCYISSGAFVKAEPYLEKALAYNPNSAFVINFMSDFYTTYIPNAAKYLEYALKGVQLDIASNDSATASFIYLHLSNALIQNGFIKEALYYINTSLRYNPDNLYSQYVRAYILFAENKNLDQTLNLLLEVYQKDTTRMDVLQEVGKIYYYKKDYETALQYYQLLLDVRSMYKMDLFWYEDPKIAKVLEETGNKAEADSLFEAYHARVQSDHSIYRNLMEALYYAYQNDNENVFKYLRLFSGQENYHYWIVEFTEMDPLFEKFARKSEFEQVMGEIKTKFRKKHKELKKTLMDKGLI
ncbi:helix-turn-helix domain-containing protein [Saccharicrinis sp. FJH54]|uniref:helix-turn-helix domain-containing protein n=1 Tax=Saccharicrinis sp. FJH54 TaxID=3344665 RepID=UPI0035D4FECD